jgi:hypothetical protein
MKSIRPTILALLLTIFASTTALAGNIPALRTMGQIPATRTAGQIPATRTNFAFNQNVPPSRFDLESAVSASFAGLIRMLFDGAALL